MSGRLKRSIASPFPSGMTTTVPKFGRGFAELAEKAETRRSLLLPLRAWALAGGVAVLVVAAFWSGGLWQQHQAPAVAAISPTARQRILMVAVGDHLARVQMLLVEIMHQPAAGPADVSETRQLAQDLVKSNRLYRQTALRDGDAGMASVLDELERVLLHISHSPNEISADELVSLQHQIESQGILFKVRVVQSEAQEKQKVAVPHPTETAL